MSRAAISSKQCLETDLARWSCGDAADDELRLLVRDDLDLVADSTLRLGASPVGKGAYSYVYDVLERGVVIKFPRSAKHTGAALREALWQYRIAQQCPHVVPVLGISYLGRDQFSGLRRGDMVPGIVMRKLAMNLQQLYGRWDHVAVACVWWKAARELLECLQCLRDHGFIHGDIKTANILVDFEPEPSFFLADFSSVKPVPRGSVSIHCNAIDTTMEYCAPETLQQSVESFDTDLYALGLCLLALITRQEPFRELQRAKNHGKPSVQQTHWLMNAVLKNDPIQLNVLTDSLHGQWSDELRFLSLILVKRLPVDECLVAISQFHR